MHPTSVFRFPLPKSSTLFHLHSRYPSPTYRYLPPHLQPSYSRYPHPHPHSHPRPLRLRLLTHLPDAGPGVALDRWLESAASDEDRNEDDGGAGGGRQQEGERGIRSEGVGRESDDGVGHGEGGEILKSGGKKRSHTGGNAHCYVVAHSGEDVGPKGACWRKRKSTGPGVTGVQGIQGGIRHRVSKTKSRPVSIEGCSPKRRRWTRGKLTKGRVRVVSAATSTTKPSSSWSSSKVTGGGKEGWHVLLRAFGFGRSTPTLLGTNHDDDFLVHLRTAQTPSVDLDILAKVFSSAFNLATQVFGYYGLAARIVIHQVYSVIMVSGCWIQNEIELLPTVNGLPAAF
ncbi:hypothetical protein R3P38DRAFT_3575651 [Favolaschia claudopus]|uniref:Uncharacterized protein n=1 Tax=Favolaschia claudopus TaxID=2862362 RepID=A0AAW0APS5_9AGAR